MRDALLCAAHVLRSSCTPLLMYSAPHVLRSSCTPLLMSSAPHVLRSSCTPLLIYSAPHVLRSSCAPLLMYSAPHVLRSSCPPLLMSSAPHVLRSSCIPLLMYSAPHVLRSSCIPACHTPTCCTPAHRTPAHHTPAHCPPAHRTPAHRTPAHRTPAHQPPHPCAPEKCRYPKGYHGRDGVNPDPREANGIVYNNAKDLHKVYLKLTALVHQDKHHSSELDMWTRTYQELGNQYSILLRKCAPKAWQDREGHHKHPTNSPPRRARSARPTSPLGSAEPSDGETLGSDDDEDDDSGQSHRPRQPRQPRQPREPQPSKWDRAAMEVRTRVLDPETSDRDKFNLPHGFGLKGVKWSVGDIAKRLHSLKALVHPDHHSRESPDEVSIWGTVWKTPQDAYIRLAEGDGEHHPPHPTPSHPIPPHPTPSHPIPPHSTPSHPIPHHPTHPIPSHLPIPPHPIPPHPTPPHPIPSHPTPSHPTPPHPQHHITPHHTTPYHTTPHHTTPHYTTPHHTTPYHTTLHHTTSYHTTSLHTTPYHTTSCTPAHPAPPHPTLGGHQHGERSGVNPVAAALGWELDDDSLSKEEFNISITWTPTRKHGRGGNSALHDRTRVTVVKQWIDAVKEAMPALITAGVLTLAGNSFALYGERGSQQKEFHGQGGSKWRSNGGGQIAFEGLAAFLRACMPEHPYVLLVKLVGRSSPANEPDHRPQKVIDGSAAPSHSVPILLLIHIYSPFLSSPLFSCPPPSMVHPLQYSPLHYPNTLFTGIL